MRKLIGLVVILAALVLGSYYGMGIITERTLKKDVNLINQSNGLLVDILQYDRGWFSSAAKLKWRLHVPERLVKNTDGQSTTVPAQDFTVDMPLSIYHGPIIFADGIKFGFGYAHTDLSLPQPYDTKFATEFTPESTKPQLKASVLVNYLNRSRLRLDVPAFKLIAKENGGVMEWLGMRNDITVSSHLNRVKGNFIIDGINVIKNTMHVTVGKVSSDYKLNQSSNGLYVGSATFAFPSLRIMNGEQKIFELEQFNMETSSDIDDGLFNSYFKSSIEKMLTNGKSYGPGLLQMSLKNIDAQVLADLNEQANKMQQSQGTDRERQQQLLMLLPQLPKLFSRGAEFQISKLHFVMPEGEVAGNMSIVLPKGETSNPFQLIQKIEGTGMLKVPVVFVKELMQQSAKQKLEKPGLQQAMVEQMQNNTQAENPTTTAPAPNEQGQVEQAQKPQVVVVDINQQAKQQADQTLADMVQTGLLTVKGADYVIEFKLVDGQLSVNGRPFSTDMVKF